MKTKKESLELIKKYQKWSNEGGEKPSLRDINLRNSNLSNSDLSDSDLSNSNLSNSNLRNSDLSNSNLSGSDLRSSDLRNSDLRNSNLSNSDLRNANIDCSAWPLSCKSIGIKVCKKIAIQLLFHAMSVECDDKEFNELKNSEQVINLLKQFHQKDAEKYWE